MTRIYLTPLPDADAQRASDAVASDIAQSGLLDGDGTAVENIATDSVDVSVSGQFRFGSVLSRKLAEELDSLGESGYTALPLFDPESGSLGRKRGYYEIESADVNPAHPTTEHVFEYEIDLAKKGTREDSWRSVRTSVDTVDTVFDGDDPALIGIPGEAVKPHWFDSAEGKTSAEPTETVTGEYGTVDLFNPTDAPTASPTLIYELPFDREGPVDVRVWDTRDREKFADAGNGNQVNTWTHAYHTGFEFDGTKVIDTGRLRVWFGPRSEALGALVVANNETYTIATGTSETHTTLTVESGGTFVVESGATHNLTRADRDDLNVQTWNDTTDTWDGTAVGNSTWEVDDVDLTRLGPAAVTAQVTFVDTDGSEAVLNATVDRGRREVLWTRPPNVETTPTGVESLLAPIASNRDTDVTGRQTITARSDTRE